MILIYFIVFGAMNALCFLIGFRAGSGKMPLPEVKMKQQERLQRRALETILQNIDNYNGTAIGQLDVPGR